MDGHGVLWRCGVSHALSETRADGYSGHLMNAVLAGLLTGLSLIVAIGAQNAYVLRLGLTRTYVGLAVVICGVSDVVLIFAGVAGIGGIVHQFPGVLSALKIVGTLYLLFYGLRCFWRARRPETLLPTDLARTTRSKVLLTTLAFTFLNPHVYLDTVLLLGSIGNQFHADRWLFAVGASVSSILWFSVLGFGARSAARLMSRPVTWRILDVGIGVVMVVVAIKISRTHVS